MQNKSRIEKDKIAEKGWLYQKHYDSFKEFLRFHKYDYDDMKISIEKANQVYQKKLGQLNAIIFSLDLLFASNSFYDMNAREMFGWQIDLLNRRLKDYLEYLLREITKE